MNSVKAKICVLLSVAALTACTTTAEKPGVLNELRSTYENLAANADAQRYAAQRLKAAERAINEAEEAWEADRDQEVIDHHIYLAERRLAIAEEAVRLAQAEQTVQNAETERRQVLLNIREAQANRAQEQASQAQARAEAAERRAQELEQSAQQLEQSKQELAQNLSQLQEQVENLKTRKTDEGIVLTLQDILFNPGEAELNPRADNTLDKLAQFLKRYQDRQLEIQGFTDSTGDADFNQQLSEQRARSVKEALVERGVDPQRVQTTGFGERRAIAANDTPAGRQRNRRVEIVIEDPTQQQQQQETVTGIQ
jgi:outer membrane protein OmpA-like peptidoglycan-associated protein